MTIQRMSSKGRISIVKIQNFTIERRQSVIPLVYGTLLLVVAVVMATVSPLERITNWYLRVSEGSFVYRMWQNPTYDLYCDVYIYNYTNIPAFLAGDDAVLKMTEVGPFRYNEKRTNRNMSIDHESGRLRMTPHINLTFLPHESVAHTKDVYLNVPNIALIAISTLAADKLGYIANLGAYYSISATGSKLFLNITAQEYLWGYQDPIVTIANRFLPGWIDFGKIGIMDRFYGQKMLGTEVQIRDTHRRFEIETWDGSAGLVEQGFKDLNTSSLCNTIKGSFEGLMFSPKVFEDKEIRLFRKQACRVFPFVYQKDMMTDSGFTIQRFQMERHAFNNTSPYACKCTENCLPNGFVDISSCYYGFPITLSKPHFIDVDPAQKLHFEGMTPEPEKHESRLDIEPNTGVPLSLQSNIQVNIAVRTNAGNPITKPLKDKVMPLMWVSLYCREAPPEVLSLLRLRFVIAPPLVITATVLLFLAGAVLGAQGFYRLLRPKYRLIEPEVVPKPRRRKSSIAINMSDNKAFKDDDDMAKEAVSLLAIREEDSDLPDLILTD
ncbi:unnamed protein product [Plutella xylostella]|uniref:(diamondback moth) hypothetical protein n=1 Tax=Plutella xylostella TaxID=51655 RepID=A0A8S4F1B7_PLUXY|nr:scavenger receptor class B member 1 [Plutella xylostella]CAG9120558.1 unnamed protein product [Plutella xylostella]